MTNSSLYTFNACDFWGETSTNSSEVWNVSLILKELRELLGQSTGTVGDSHVGKTKDVRDQHRRYGDIKGQLWLPMVSTVEAQGAVIHMHTENRGQVTSPGTCSRHPFLTENTEYTAVLMALLTLVIHYVLVFTGILSIFLFNKFYPSSHSCFYKTQGNEQIL